MLYLAIDFLSCSLWFFVAMQYAFGKSYNNYSCLNIGKHLARLAMSNQNFEERDRTKKDPSHDWETGALSASPDRD